MSQIRLFEYMTQGSSEYLNLKNLGILKEGLYAGFEFDTRLITEAFTLVLTHNTTAITRVVDDVREKYGVVLMPNGITVLESSRVEFPISISSSTLNPTKGDRKDLLVMTHKYSKSVGGYQASYKVLTGPQSATTSTPAVAPYHSVNPFTDIVLGELLLPPTTKSLTDSSVVYTRKAYFLLRNDLSLSYDNSSKKLSLKSGSINLSEVTLN